ncbi:hypothetical protein F443_08429 [Phytophthora nicotianae P1569]|uniref:Uncharacterized protein n=1 Tax=Phytophthora nicotianae P1569 TaxID=1317065 RepID=V9F793_PHYNI|nr:hypothetical protein F443_08429 [Phytophthora nicotianae P1569]
MSTPANHSPTSILLRAPRGKAANGPSDPSESRVVPATVRPGRYAPPETLLQTLDDALARDGGGDDLRLIALREVQRARVLVDDKLKLFISAGQLAKYHQLDEILAAINKAPQTTTWSSAASSLCDFIRIPGRGIRFMCTSRNMSAKLGGSAGPNFWFGLHHQGRKCIRPDVLREFEERAIRSR